MRNGGRIVNLSTMNTVRLVPGIGTYAASKGARWYQSLQSSSC